MLHKKTVLVKKRHFYVKKLLFYKLSGCKNTAFLQKYIFVKKQLFYVKKLLFYKLTGCKNTAFLQKYIFVKKLRLCVPLQTFTNSPVEPFLLFSKFNGQLIDADTVYSP